MQEKQDLQIQLEYQFNRAEQATARAQQDDTRAQEAESYLCDANSQVEYLEWRLNKMSHKMRKVAIGIHLAIKPHHQVRQSLSPISCPYLPAPLLIPTTAPPPPHPPCPEHPGLPGFWLSIFATVKQWRRVDSVVSFPSLHVGRHLTAGFASVAGKIRLVPTSY